MKKRAAVLLLFSCLLAGCAGKPTDAPKEPEEKETEVKEPETKDNEKDEPEKAEEPVAKEEPEEKKEPQNPYEETDFACSTVRNDKTGNWRISVINKGFDINDYAKQYYDDHVGDGEIHAIVNFANNTTTKISKVGGLINVTVHEYVEDEEHDANALFSGMTLSDKYFDPETGAEVEF